MAAGPNWNARRESYKKFTPVSYLENRWPGVSDKYRELAASSEPQNDTLEAIRGHERKLRAQAVNAKVAEKIQANEAKQSNYSTPAKNQKTQEVVDKLGSTGTTGKFTNIAKNPDLWERYKNDTDSADLQVKDFDSYDLNGKFPTYDSWEKYENDVDSSDLQGALDKSRALEPENLTLKYKVKLVAEPGVGGVVTFEAMPTISESRSASYDPVSVLHHPGDILKYKSSSARSWGIDVKLISRTPQEAAMNLNSINKIRAWVMPFYGMGTGSNGATSRYLGAPPPILTLTAYGDTMIGPVKCVLESYSWTWPNDVDYIPAGTGSSPVPFPAIVSLTLTLKESFSPAEYSGFDILSYRAGDMKAAFQAVKANKQQEQNQTPQVVQAPPTPSEPSKVTDTAPPLTNGQRLPADTSGQWGGVQQSDGVYKIQGAGQFAKKL
jgi:hypothetical protein